jgi:6-phosphogluconolactonase
MSLLPINTDGSLLPAVDFVQHHGSGPDPHRQEGPHVHSVNLDAGNRFVLVADLGLDRLMTYRIDLEHGKLILQSEAQGEAGSGPRHLDFHPNGRFVYLVNELNSTLSVYQYDLKDGKLDEIQVAPTLPDGYQGSNFPADVHITPDGKFIYASNRGHDSLAIFRVDETNGRLSVIGHAATQGMTPRNFAIDPNGNYLLAANQDTGRCHLPDQYADR